MVSDSGHLGLAHRGTYITLERQGSKSGRATMRFPVFLEDEIYNSSMHLLKDRLISHGIDEDQ